MIRRLLMPLLLAILFLVSGCSDNKALQARLLRIRKPLIRTDDYRVGPRDVIQVEVRGQPDLSRATMLRPDGKVTLNLLGDVYVSAMTPTEIDEVLTRRYKEYIVGADVTVSVVAFNSKKIFVFGAVPREGEIPYRGEMTILELMAQVGGVLPRSEPKAITITRAVPNEHRTKIYQVNLDKIIIEGRTEQNIYLQPNDIVHVPLNGFARIGFALDNVFFPLRSFFSFFFLGDSVNDLKKKHKW